MALLPDLHSHSLDSAPAGPVAVQAMQAALEGVDPYRAVQLALNLKEGSTTWQNSAGGKIWIIGAGKAGVPMAQAAVEFAGDILAGGLVVVKEGYSAGLSSIGTVQVVEAGHPLPDQRSVQAAQAMLDLLDRIPPGDQVLGVISGGGSALLTLPVPGVTLADLQELTRQLLACGASIHEINTLRKHLDLVKGGRLAKRAAPTRMLIMILSDVVGDNLEVIASGPTVPDPSTFSGAWAVLEKYALLSAAPPAILDVLRAGMAGQVEESPKPGDSAFTEVTNLLVGTGRLAADAALATAQRAGFHPFLLTSTMQGEARDQGILLARLARQVFEGRGPVQAPVCIAAAGETTVTLRGAGLGGRNQELALSAVHGLAGLPGTLLVTLATDGGDGPTDAAGAVVTGDTLARAQALGLSPETFLEKNDSYHFFAALDDLLRPGPTRTNVNDLVLLFVGTNGA